MIFVNSMSDLFHKDVPDDYIVAVGRVMQVAHWHTYQVLTKRSERLRDLLGSKLAFVANEPHSGGASASRTASTACHVSTTCREHAAAVRFLSIEPLLEDLGTIDLAGIAWVIVGGESGPGARPMQPAWVRSIRAQCRQARVPFFFKQWGGPKKAVTGRSLDGRTYDEMPPRARHAVPTSPQLEGAIQAIRSAWV